MRKLYSLLLLCLIGTVSAWAETETVTVATWDFTGQTTATNLTAGTASITENNTSCTEASAPECCAGLYFQNPTKWKSYASKENGIRNVDSGDRMCIVPGLKANDVITITCNGTDAINTTKYTGTANSDKTQITFTMEADGNFYFKIVKAGGKIAGVSVWPTINSIVVTREVEAGTCENPTYKISGVDGAARKFTLACTTANSTLYYSTTELEAGAEGWTKYTGEATTSAGTIYAYASAGDANSEVISFATGAGSEITLNAPYANKTAYADGSYTVSIGSDQSTLSIVPSTVNYYYSIDGGAEAQGTSVNVPAGKTLTVYAAADGYTNSANTVCETSVRPTRLVKVWNQDYTTVTQATGTGACEVTIDETAAFTVGERSFYNITGYKANNENVTAELNPNVGINTASHFYLRCNSGNSGILKNANNGGTTGYIGIQNLTPGQYIIITTNSNPLSATEGCTDNLGMNTTSEYIFQATATEASIFFQHGTYNYVKTITVYNPTEDITINSTGVSSYVTTYALDFSDVEGLTAMIAEDETEEQIILRKVTEVPAGTAIIVRGTPDQTYTVPAGSCTELEGNLLQGSVTQGFDVSTATMPVYALKNSDGEFHHVASTVVIPAKKAYLISHFDNAASAKGFKVLGEEGEEATAVSTVSAAESEKSAKLYNAAGQLVGAAYKGLVIDENGNKYVR